MKTTIIFLAAVFLFMSCNWSNDKEKEGFYDYSQTIDLYRIPIIEPYEITSSDKGSSWLMDFKGSNSPSNLGTGKVDSVGVKGQYFIVYSKRTALPAIGMIEAWFVINATTKEEKVFMTRQEYNEYLKNQNIDETKLYDINTVFRDFEEKRKLPPEWPEQPSK
jgi:hypothetical protein